MSQKTYYPKYHPTHPKFRQEFVWNPNGSLTLKEHSHMVKKMKKGKKALKKQQKRECREANYTPRYEQGHPKYRAEFVWNPESGYSLHSHNKWVRRKKAGRKVKKGFSTAFKIAPKILKLKVI